MIPALIGAGASLLGGILGRNSEKKGIAAQNAYNAPDKVRARAEAAGFNPLLFVGPGVGQQAATGGSAYMGTAIADAGMLLADRLAKRQSDLKVSQLERENQALADKVQSLTLRPKVGGVYAQREATPMLPQALGVSDDRRFHDSVPVDGGSDGGGVRSAGADLRPLPETLPVDRRRNVDNADIKTSSGFSVIDNPNVSFPIYVPTLDGDEPLQWYDLPTLAINFVASGGWHFGVSKRDEHERIRARGPVYTMGGKKYALQPPNFYPPRKAKSKHPLHSLGF